MNTNSQFNIKNSPQSEQLYLSRNAWLAVSIGILLSFNIISPLLISNGLDSFVIMGFTNTLELITLVFLMVMLVKTMKISRQISRSSFLFGYLQDEFLEHTNNKGYKYGFIVMLVVTILIGFGFDILLADNASLSFKQMGTFCAAIGSFAYGATVLYFLKVDADE